MRDTTHSTLAATVWPAQEATRFVRPIALALAGTLLLAASAKMQVIFYPVPMTMQTLVVLMLGAAYGARLAGATMALYLLEGLAGMPVFAGAVAGPAYFMGTTGGFLVGMLVAALAVGWAADRGIDRTPARLMAVMLAGHVVIFAFGFGWLAALIGPTKAWLGGVQPFLLATALKTLLAGFLMMAGWRLAMGAKPQP